MRISTPRQIKTDLPLQEPEKVAFFRKEAARIFSRKDPRLALIIGPCSLHDEESSLDYAKHLKKLLPEIQHTFFPLMRTFFEKPRTRLGWKGMLYDPYLDGSGDIEAGIRKTRELLLKITQLGIPCAAELLEPLMFPYVDDLIVWGLVGARTSASQTHRQLASKAPFPVGFKNDFRGRIDVAIDGIIASSSYHYCLGIDVDGNICREKTEGNPLTHLVLRGSDLQTNYDFHSIDSASSLLTSEGLSPRIMVDCSHGNCSKNFQKQGPVFVSLIQEHHPALMGLMLESHLYAGRQPIHPNTPLDYGVSITDSCLGWEETEELLRSTSTLLVQNWCSQDSTIQPVESMTSTL